VPREDSDTDIGTLLSAVTPTRVDWLWQDRIPLGKITILDGDPGLGKSVMTADLAARVSHGLPMPDGSPGRAGGVVLLTAEDGLEDTVAPRLDAAGADRSRVLSLDMVPDLSTGGVKPPVLPLDARYVERAAERMNAVLIVIDPLTAYLAAEINSHRDQDCRRALLPLKIIAERTGAAVLVVRHLNKAVAGGNPLYRGGGSIGIIGAARSGLLVARDPDNEDRRVLASTKCNLAKLPPSLSFDLSAAPNGALRIDWIGTSAHTADSLLAAPKDGEDRDAVQDAVDVLSTILSQGPRKAKDVKDEARKAGVSERTLHRAKVILGVKSQLFGFGKSGIWEWRLPRDCQETAKPI